MKLRERPELSMSWPPTWSGWYGKGTKLAYAEEPDKLLSIKEAEDHIVLEAEYEKNLCTGFLPVKNKEFRKKLIKVLEQYVGRSIAEIGSIDLPF